MPKIKHHFKLLFYEKDNTIFSEIDLFHYEYSEFIKDFNDYANLVASGEFTYIYRVDLVDCGRILASCMSLCHVIDQKNYTINFNPY